MSTLSHELRGLFRMSVPVALTQLGLMLTTVVDTMMVGHLGQAQLAGLALGNTWHWAFMSICLGVLMGLDPLISQAHGRGDDTGAVTAMQRGILLSLILTVPVGVLLLATEPSLLALGQDPEVARLAAEYNRWKLPSVPGMLLFTVQRQYLQGRAIMAPATWAMVVANVFNVFANWVLIWGHLGFPAMGLRGAAIATSLTCLVLPIALGSIMHRLDLHVLRGWSPRVLSARGLMQILGLGAPVGVHMALENWAFAGSAMMAGWIDVTSVGSHHVTLNLAALAFMLPLGLSMGAATRVGNLIGAGDLVGMRRALRAAVMLAVGIMGLCAVAFLVGRRALPRLYTDEPAIIALVASTLPVVAAFQIADGVQVVSAGLLRGMGRPRPGAVVNLISYYFLSYPLAYALAFLLGWQLRGIWVALAAGVTLAAGLLLSLCVRASRRGLDELSHHVH